MKAEELAKYIDHTNLKPNATREDIKKLCMEARKYGFYSVCVNPYWVNYCHSELFNSDVKVCTVVGFPLGASTDHTKAFEASEVLKNGVDEIDYVINISALKDGDYDYLRREAIAIREEASDTVIQAIIETAYLEDGEIAKVASLLDELQIDFIKTSTGFASDGAKVEHIEIMKQNIKKSLIKASGGIKDITAAKKMINAGASRLGLSSSVAIMESLTLSSE